MSIYKSIKKKRTIRLFQNKEIQYKILEKCVDAARLSSSAKNIQPLEYIIIDDQKTLTKLLPFLTFGGFVSEDKKAKKGCEPKALIIIIAKKDISEKYYKYDIGIAAQNIALVAYENGLGCCIQGAIEKEKIKQALDVPDKYFVDLVISLGYPAEKPVVEEREDLEYFRKQEILHIPKRKLKDVLHKNKF